MEAAAIEHEVERAAGHLVAQEIRRDEPAELARPFLCSFDGRGGDVHGPSRRRPAARARSRSCREVIRVVHDPRTQSLSQVTLREHLKLPVDVCSHTHLFTKARQGPSQGANR